MNIQLKIRSSRSNGPGFNDSSTFEVAVGYDANNFNPWHAFIIKAKPHVEFRHTADGEGKTLEDAVRNLARTLEARLDVAIESRPSIEQVRDAVFAEYDKLVPDVHSTNGPSRMSLTAIERAIAPVLFKAGWTLGEFWHRADGSMWHDAMFARYREKFPKAEDQKESSAVTSFPEDYITLMESKIALVNKFLPGIRKQCMSEIDQEFHLIDLISSGSNGIVLYVKFKRYPLSTTQKTYLARHNVTQVVWVADGHSTEFIDAAPAKPDSL